MKFAKIVFTGAGIWGLLVLSPLYFMFDIVGQTYPPAITHPDFYYGFAGLGIAWQLAFLVIGRDPARFRPMMIPAICEKAIYVISLLSLYGNGRIELGQLAVGAPDLVLGCLFVAAVLQTRRSTSLAPAFSQSARGASISVAPRGGTAFTVALHAPTAHVEDPKIR